MWVGQRASEGMNSTRNPLLAYRLFTPFHPPKNEIKRLLIPDPDPGSPARIFFFTKGFRVLAP